MDNVHDNTGNIKNLINNGNRNVNKNNKNSVNNKNSNNQNHVSNNVTTLSTTPTAKAYAHVFFRCVKLSKGLGSTSNSITLSIGHMLNCIVFFARRQSLAPISTCHDNIQQNRNVVKMNVWYPDIFIPQLPHQLDLGESR